MSDFHLDYELGNDANDGSSWAQAWKTITTGATAARIAPGDRVKIAKSPAPASIGNALWTDLSKTVELAAALTKAVDQCESGWTAANTATVTHPTDSFKQGSAAVNVTKATYATATLYAYKAFSAADFSAYSYLTLWVRVDAAVADAARWTVRLCSDAAGAVTVDTFAIPALPATNRWVPLKIARNGGGALGASIQSVAIYSGSSAPTNNQDIRLDNIQACNDLSLCSLISKSGAEQSTSEGWYGIQSIVGTTVLLDNDTETIATAGRGYSGTTETVATYRRETIKITMVASGSNAELVQDTGTAGSPITFSGGWNTSSGLQDGESFLDGQCGVTHLSVATSAFVTLERLSMTRFACALRTGITFAGIIARLGTVCNCGATGLTAPVNIVAPSSTIEVSSVNNCQSPSAAVNVGASNVRCTIGSLRNHFSSGIVLDQSGNTIDLGKVTNIEVYGLRLTAGGNRIDVDEMRDIGTANVFSGGGDGVNVLRIASIAGTEFAGTDYMDVRTQSHNHNNSGYHRIFTDGAQIDSLATDFAAPATGSMWKLLTSAVTRTSGYPLRFEIAEVAVVANKLATIRAVLKKAHATQVNGRLVVRGGQIAGVPADVVATLANSTGEQELELTFTPTEAGVVRVEAWAEYVSGHAAVYVDRFTLIHQAAA